MFNIWRIILWAIWLVRRCAIFSCIAWVVIAWLFLDAGHQGYNKRRIWLFRTIPCLWLLLPARWVAITEYSLVLMLWLGNICSYIEQHLHFWVKSGTWTNVNSTSCAWKRDPFAITTLCNYIAPPFNISCGCWLLGVCCRLTTNHSDVSCSTRLAVLSYVM